MGCIWGLVCGDLPHALAVSLFFELLWVDLFPAGTYVPPQGLAATLAALALTRQNGLVEPFEVLPVLILSLPMATFGTRIEQMHRVWQDKGYSQLLRASRRPGGDVTTGNVLLRGIARLFGENLLFFAVGVSILQMAYLLVKPFTNVPRLEEYAGWPQLWFLASIGGVLSLRWRQSYWLLAACALGVAAVGYFGFDILDYFRAGR